MRISQRRSWIVPGLLLAFVTISSNSCSSCPDGAFSINEPVRFYSCDQSFPNPRNAQYPQGSWNFRKSEITTQCSTYPAGFDIQFRFDQMRSGGDLAFQRIRYHANGGLCGGAPQYSVLDVIEYFEV